MSILLLEATVTFPLSSTLYEHKAAWRDCIDAVREFNFLVINEVTGEVITSFFNSKVGTSVYSSLSGVLGGVSETSSRMLYEMMVIDNKKPS